VPDLFCGDTACATSADKAEIPLGVRSHSLLVHQLTLSGVQLMQPELCFGCS
jgi:hypothetical protein